MKTAVGEYVVEINDAGQVIGLFKEFGGEVRGFRIGERVRAVRDIPPFVYVEDRGTVVEIRAEIRHSFSLSELIRVRWDPRRKKECCNTNELLWVKFYEIARL